MGDETAGVVAAIVAVASVWVAWWGATPRRTRRLRDKVQILAALPSDSTERERLLKHVDRMVKDEIDDDRTDDLVARIWGIVGFCGASWILLSIALDNGGWWWVYAVIVSVGTVVLLVAVVISLRKWWRRRSREPERE
jgi:uncharacterized membrane protein YeaQ/YmgE (transglycosylase-associated protein family)